MIAPVRQILAALLLLFACAAASAQGVTARTVVLGQSAPLSGPQAALGEEIRNGALAYLRRLNDAGEPISGTVRRLAEPAQVDPELLQQLKAAGVLPGATGDYQYSEGYVLVQMHGSDEGLELPVEVASHIFLVDDRR